MLFLTVIGFLITLLKIMRKSSFIENRVEEKTDAKKMCKQLTTDGLLVLHLIKDNTNNYCVTSVISNLNKLISESD